MFAVEKESNVVINEGDEIKYSTSELRLIKDGIQYKDVSIITREKGYLIFSSNVETSRKLLNFSLSQFPHEIELFLKLMDNWKGFAVFVGINMFDEENSRKLILLALHPILEDWNYQFSFSQFKETFDQVVPYAMPLRNDDNKNLFIKDKDINCIFEHKFSHSPINDEIKQYLERIENSYKRVFEFLSLKSLSNKLITTFNFPLEIRASCEQYLLYFAQFLQDLGINATSSLKEEAGKVLFSVAPTDDIEALDNIREALAIYLKLPESPIVYNDSFAAMRLQQQIENLQHSQRMAARELRFTEKLLIDQSDTIQEKNLTIAQQQSVIEQQNKIIEKITSKSIMVDSLENKEELERFCEGFEIGKSEFLVKYFGLHLNPATVLKNAGKKILGEEENKSILKLDEESNKKDN